MAVDGRPKISDEIFALLNRYPQGFWDSDELAKAYLPHPIS